MKTYQITEAKGIDSLKLTERATPKPGPGEVLVRVRATSLNYRDHAILMGTYRTKIERDTIPLSDGAGEVVAVGASVTRFKAGDRVAASFFQVWIDGAPPKQRAALGAPLDG